MSFTLAHHLRNFRLSKKIRIRFDFLRFRICCMHFDRKGWGLRKNGKPHAKISDSVCNSFNSVGWNNSFFASSEMVSNKPGVPSAKGPPTGTLHVPDQLLCQTPAPAADLPVQQDAEAVSQNNTANIAPTKPEPTRKQGRPRRTKTKKPGLAYSNQGEVRVLGVWLTK